MVALDIVVDGEKRNLYMDGGLHKQLTTKVIPSVQKKDWDWFCIVDGLEGSGKSVFAMQIAKVLDPNFNTEQIAFTSNDFVRCVLKAKPHSCIIYDEAFTGMSSRSALSEVNRLLVSLMMEMRQKNLFIILVMPTFFMLDKYAVLHRTKGLFHVYMRDGRRGFWHFYNQRRTKYLYLTGKKFYEYTGSKPIIFGRFQNQYVVNEEVYREFKKKSLNKKARNTRAETYKEQRDTLFWILNEDCKVSQNEITRKCRKWDYSITQSTISEVLATKKKQYLIKEIKAEDAETDTIDLNKKTENI